MSVYNVNILRRTIRKFQQKPIQQNTLLKLVDSARIAPSAANMQPLKYKIVTDEDTCAAMFPHLHWAGYLPNGTPDASERPTAYILIFQDLNLRSADASIDVGAAAMTMTLCAQELGISSCWIGSVDRNAVCDLFHIDESLKLHLVIALGYPAQNSQIADITDKNIKYFMDSDNVLNVPKRALEDILL